MCNFRRGIGPTNMVLLLTTTGRKSGLPRLTPLQYQLIDGIYYVASARGAQADWFRNLQANPRVQIEVAGICMPGLAEAITDPRRIADFLVLRKKEHPVFMGLMMRMEGLPLRHTPQELERFAATKALAAIRPV
jgi:deazaflavin-dependent oxidoreductase (nitroreductase family)